ncbi:hypothetical protein VNO77_41487 [Canavalia gladiata]|uniref:Uncharacterized protein n=1 Tax=Canavalia gladiata TaxID=3824 RepID=A0AAN9PSK4_CANGL
MQDVVGGSKPLPTTRTSEVPATRPGEVPPNRPGEVFAARLPEISVAGLAEIFAARLAEVSVVGPVEVFVAGLDEAAADWPSDGAGSNIFSTWVTVATDAVGLDCVAIEKLSPTNLFKPKLTIRMVGSSSFVPETT